MDFLKKTADRAQQSVTESFGSATKTEFSAETIALLARADEIRTNTAQLIHALENYVQPDPAQKLLSGLTGDSQSKGQALAQHLKSFATKLEIWKHAAAPAFDEGAKAYSAIGQSEKDMYTAMGHGLAPLRHVLQSDIHLLDAERGILTNNRLDMDTLKNKKGAPADQVAKAQATFDAQQQKVCALVNQLELKLNDYRTHFKLVVDADLAHYTKCVQALQELQTKL